MTLQDQIDRIMDNFDFNRVHRMMVAEGREWVCTGVPDESELRSAARRHLREAAGPARMCGSGGFLAINEDGVLQLHWGVDTRVLMDGIEPEEGE